MNQNKKSLKPQIRSQPKSPIFCRTVMSQGQLDGLIDRRSSLIRCNPRPKTYSVTDRSPLCLIPLIFDPVRKDKKKTYCSVFGPYLGRNL